MTSSPETILRDFRTLHLATLSDKVEGSLIGRIAGFMATHDGGRNRHAEAIIRNLTDKPGCTDADYAKLATLRSARRLDIAKPAEKHVSTGTIDKMARKVLTQDTRKWIMRHPNTSSGTRLKVFVTYLLPEMLKSV